MSIEDVRRQAAQDDIAALKAVTREAHEAIKDLRAVIREANQAKEELLLRLTATWEHGVDAVVKQGLESYQATLAKAIEDAQKRVNDRFDRLADLMLGEDPRTRRKGEPSLEELILTMKERP